MYLYRECVKSSSRKPVAFLCHSRAVVERRGLRHPTGKAGDGGWGAGSCGELRGGHTIWPHSVLLAVPALLLTGGVTDFDRPVREFREARR